MRCLPSPARFIVLCPCALLTRALVLLSPTHLPACVPAPLSSLLPLCSSEVVLRFDIQRRQVSVLCQAAATLVSVFSRKIRLVQRYMTPAAGRRLLNQYMTVGFLVRGAWDGEGGKGRWH